MLLTLRQRFPERCVLDI